MVSFGDERSVCIGVGLGDCCPSVSLHYINTLRIPMNNCQISAICETVKEIWFFSGKYVHTLYIVAFKWCYFIIILKGIQHFGKYFHALFSLNSRTFSIYDKAFEIATMHVYGSFLQYFNALFPLNAGSLSIYDNVLSMDRRKKIFLDVRFIINTIILQVSRICLVK